MTPEQYGRLLTALLAPLGPAIICSSSIFALTMTENVYLSGLFGTVLSLSGITTLLLAFYIIARSN